MGAVSPPPFLWYHQNQNDLSIPTSRCERVSKERFSPLLFLVPQKESFNGMIEDNCWREGLTGFPVIQYFSVMHNVIDENYKAAINGPGEGIKKGLDTRLYPEVIFGPRRLRM